MTKDVPPAATGTESFEMGRTIRLLIRVAPWFMVFCTLVCLLVLLVPGQGQSREDGLLIVIMNVTMLVCGLGFATGAAYGFQAVRRLPMMATTVDREGLWPSACAREAGLVRWSEMVRLRERAFLQRLEAVDLSGRVVAKLEYQLQNFARLRAIVLERAALDRLAAGGKMEYSKSVLYHLFNLGQIVGFSALGWYVAQDRPLLGYGCIAAVVGSVGITYWVMPYRLRLSGDVLQISLPGRQRVVQRQDIRTIEIADDDEQQVKQPKVTIHLKNASKPIHLKELGVPAVELLIGLQSWHKGT